MIYELLFFIFLAFSAHAVESVPEDITCGRGTKLVDGVCIIPKHESEPIIHGDCLIATASYGSKLAPQVQMLREIRDNTLLNTESGKLFMNGFNAIYYSFSPTIAQWENENDVFKEAVKLFITPMIATLSIMTLADDSDSSVMLYGLSSLGLIVGMYVVSPAFLVWKVKQMKTNRITESGNKKE